MNYKTLLLQRLANPLLPYNPMPNDQSTTSGSIYSDPNEPKYNSQYPVNPYITVDWMPINLTVFNGEQEQLSGTPPLAVASMNGVGSLVSMDPDDVNFSPPQGQTTPLSPMPSLPVPVAPSSAMAAAANYPNPTSQFTGAFGTAQRGQTVPTVNAGTYLNLYTQWMDAFPGGSGTYTATNLVFGYSLMSTTGGQAPGMTLGYLNQAFYGNNGAGHPWSTSDSPAAPANYLGDPNMAMFAGNVGANGYIPTFPWITWNNRPFVSHYELMQVPASSPSRLLWEYGFTGTTSNPYDGANSAPTTAAFLAPFKHLLNFEMSTSTGGGSDGTQPRQADVGVAPHFYRLFDYVRVPSRFVGTEYVLNPSYTQGQIGSNATFTSTNDGNLQGSTNPGSNGANLEKAMASYLHPPFNRVSKHRDPGKVNPNTIAHQNQFNMGGDTSPTGGNTDTNAFIWNAILNAPPVSNASGSTSAAQTLAGPLWSSVSASIHNNNTSMTTGATPSWFANPFRSAAGADLQLPPGLPLRGVDVTFLRPYGYATSGAGGGASAQGITSPYLLFDFPPAEIANSGGGGAGSSSLVGSYNAPDRNSYFRYQNLQRMGNLLTTRSNVYAVWITTGYFQVQPWNGGVPDFIHPDGYQLADELGADNGTVVRHRGFYMFDRTIPVCFERGVDHNVEKAILLKRFIE